MPHSQVRSLCSGRSFLKQNVECQRKLKHLIATTYKKTRFYFEERKISWDSFLRLSVHGELDEIKNAHEIEMLNSKKQPPLLSLYFQKLLQPLRLLDAQWIFFLRPSNKVWEIKEWRMVQFLFSQLRFPSFRKILKIFWRHNVEKDIAPPAWDWCLLHWEPYSLTKWDLSEQELKILQKGNMKI